MWLQFPQHNLTVEAVSPGLFADKSGTYWDVPLSMAIDLASVASDSGTSYHLSMHHNSGSPKPFDGDQTHGVPATLLPGLCVKSAFSFKKNIDIWIGKAQKLKMVQPYDMFLSNPHISASGTIGKIQPLHSLKFYLLMVKNRDGTIYSSCMLIGLVEGQLLEMPKLGQS